MCVYDRVKLAFSTFKCRLEKYCWLSKAKYYDLNEAERKEIT